MLRRLVIALGLSVVLAALVTPIASAAPPTPSPSLDRRRERRPELPIPEFQDVPILPAIPPPLPFRGNTSPVEVQIDEIRITGNSAIPIAELEAIAAPYEGRSLNGEALEELRLALTNHYIERGFVNSGALLPDQDFAERVLRVEIVEGRLSEIRMLGVRGRRAAYLRTRLEAAPDERLNVHEIENRLRLLQADSQIDTVQAELRPSAKLGEAILIVRISDASPVHVLLSAANDRSPAIGAENGQIDFGIDNLIGRGDVLATRTTLSEGLRDFQGVYSVPLNRWGTLFDFHGRIAESKIVESPFDSLDIESEFAEVGFSLSHPVYHSLRNEVNVGAIVEWRRGQNRVDGFDFSFSEGAEDGETVVTVLRLFQELIHRDRSQIFAFRSTLNLGIPVLDATEHSDDREDSEFVNWLIQAQWVRRFEPWAVEAVIRADAQISFDRLPPLEQFSVGGRYSVRGYRENTLVRDTGVATSLEVRVPVLRRPDGRSILQLVPFIDYGFSKSVDRGPAVPSPKSLLGMGIGTRWWMTDQLFGEFYWAESLLDSPTESDGDLQDQGIYFRVTAQLF